MSEIPYFFETPVPKYFRDNGWFDNPKTRLFVSWAFERCSTDERSIPYDGQKLTLKPYQFIFGRKICATDLGLTESEVRNQVKVLMNAGFLKNATNSTTKRYSVYQWVLTAFVKTNNQVNNQVATKWRPSNNHNQDDKMDRYKNDHQPYPSSFDELADDFSSKENKTEQNEASIQNEQVLTQHNIDYQPEVVKIEVYKDIFLTQDDLEACIAIKGSLEAVKNAIEYIMRSPGRKRKIYNWPNALSTWNIKNDIKPRLKDNEEMGKRLDQEYSNSPGWRCELHVDRKKDQKGVLFFNSTPTGNSEPIFISFIDPEFKEKTSKVLRDKRMQKGRISKS